MANKNEVPENKLNLGFVDNLEFQEPEKTQFSELNQQKIINNDNGVLEETLFANGNNSSLEPLSDGDNGYYLAGEVLDFKEPTMPSVIHEEVLFSTEEEVIDVPTNNNSPTILSEHLFSINDLSDGFLSDFTENEYVEKNFAQKLLEADSEILNRYNELKNYMLKFKGVKSRVSNDFDSFNIGRTSLIKLGYSTKSLKLYLNLDFDSVEPRLKCKNAGHKKAYEQVPVFLRIKSPRAMKNAKYLIDKVVERFSLKLNPKAVYVDSIQILNEKAKTYN